MASRKKTPDKTKTKDGEKNKGGRPRKEIDLQTLAQLVRIQCTAEECARFFAVSADTIDLRVKENGYAGFADFFENHSAEGKVSLRRLQWQSAQGARGVAPSIAMQIWLGKQVLGQRDRNAVTGDDGGPVKLESTVRDRRYEDMTREELQAELSARSAAS